MTEPRRYRATATIESADDHGIPLAVVAVWAGRLPGHALVRQDRPHQYIAEWEEQT